MDARRYYQQAHAIPKGTSCVPHVEDSGPAGRPCFRRGTLRDNPSVVCAYPYVEGSLDFWAVSDLDGAVYVGADVDDNLTFDGTPDTLPLYVAMQDARSDHIRQLPDHLPPAAPEYVNFRAYPPRVRCSRLAFAGGLGYQPGYITLPNVEHPSSDGPTVAADTFLGWYGFSADNRENGIINPFTMEGWGRPAFDFPPIGGHADQSWAYAPATPSRVLDVQAEMGTTTIPAGSWGNPNSRGQSMQAKGLPLEDIDIDNWWLLALVQGDHRHGHDPAASDPSKARAGKATPLYWNPEFIRTLTFFGEPGTPNLTQDLFLTILYRIYATHCTIDPNFAGISFPPGFLVDARILAETWESKCTQDLIDAAGIRPHVLASSQAGLSPTHRIYLGTSFSVRYRCPFPIWRRTA